MLREEYKLREFMNRVLIKIFGSKWQTLKWDWKKLYNEEFRIPYSAPDIISVITSRIVT